MGFCIHTVCRKRHDEVREKMKNPRNETLSSTFSFLYMIPFLHIYCVCIAQKTQSLSYKRFIPFFVYVVWEGDAETIYISKHIYKLESGIIYVITEKCKM